MTAATPPEPRNPYEQAFRRACDHANAGPDLTGLSYGEARLAVAQWNMVPLFADDPPARNICPDCGESLLIVLGGPREGA